MNLSGSNNFSYFQKLLSTVKKLLKAVIYVITHDIYRLPPCKNPFCLFNETEKCSADVAVSHLSYRNEYLPLKISSPK